MSSSPAYSDQEQGPDLPSLSPSLFQTGGLELRSHKFRLERWILHPYLSLFDPLLDSSDSSKLRETREKAEVEGYG